MATHHLHSCLGRYTVIWLTVTGLLASENTGVVQSGGLPIPGATVTATQGDKKVVTTTDERGAYTFPDLADGVWSLQVDMLGFGRVTRDVGIGMDAPKASWDLKLLAPGAILAAVPAPVASPAPATATATTPPAASKPNPAPQAPNRQAANQNPQGGGRGRPSIRQAQQQAQQQAQTGYQRLDVNASGQAGSLEEGAISGSEIADLNQSASDSLLVNGSVSRGLNMPQQDDWFAGRGGMGMMGPGGPGMGGPGGENALGGPQAGSDQAAVPQAAAAGGGPGGGRGMGGAGGGGFGGGGRGMGGPGGGFAGRGGRGGPGGRFGGRAGVAAFGNARRDRRMQYTGNATFTLDNSVWDARAFSLTGQDTAKAGLWPRLAPVSCSAAR